MPDRPDIEAKATDCRSRATLLEPLLDSFYARIAARRDDFAQPETA
jgi:hypothetical protein